MSRRPPARSGNGSRNRLSTAVTVPSDQLMRGDGHRQSVSNTLTSRFPAKSKAHNALTVFAKRGGCPGPCPGPLVSG